MPKTNVEQLKDRIEGHTGRRPVSNDPEYLATRLADLDRRRVDSDAAEKEMVTTADPTVVMTISMHQSTKAATVRIAGGERMNISELVRVALREFAQKRGYKDELQHFKED